MPIYFFDVDDNGMLFFDEVGSFLEDDVNAQHEAMSSLYELVRTALAHEQRRIEIKVRDTTGRVLYWANLQFRGEQLT